MLRTLVKRFTTPGGFSPDGALSVCVILLAMLFLLDRMLDSEILLQGIYVFPLAGIVFHSGSSRRNLLGFGLTVGLQLFTIFSENLTRATKISSSLIAIAASTLVLVLAKVARENYLDAAELALRDPLTGLHNRRGFEYLAAAELTRQQRYGSRLSVALIDLDHFKELNDVKGHKAGDAALNLLADVLRDCTRKSDLVARIGGDEFAILMPNLRQADCESFCQQLVTEIARRMSKCDFAITASIGAVTYERVPESLNIASEMADEALYEAKALGKNCVVSR